MPGQQVRQRRQTTQPVTAFGQKITFSLGKGMLYRELMLRFYGNITWTAPLNVAANIGRGDEWALIDRIDIFVNGNDLIRTFSGPMLRIINQMWENSFSRPSLTFGDGATAAPTFDSTLVIPFWQPQSFRPMDTALDSSKVSDFRIEITIASTAQFTSATAPTAIAANIDILSLESFGVDPSSVFSEMRLYQIQQTISGVNSAYQVQLPVGPLYRGFFFNAFTTGTGYTTADLPNAITNVKITSGTTVFRDIPWAVLRDWQRQRIGWRRDFVQQAANSPAVATAGGVYLRTAKSSLVDEDSVAFLDLCQDGYMTEAIDTYGFSELNLEFHVAAACSLWIVPIQVYPPRGR